MCDKMQLHAALSSKLWPPGLFQPARLAVCSLLPARFLLPTVSAWVIEQLLLTSTAQQAMLTAACVSVSTSPSEAATATVPDLQE